MEQKDKQLLLKDLSARLTYGVKIETPKGIGNLGTIKLTIFYHELGVNIKATERDYFPLDECKPYLRPMSSMTEEECLELSKLKPIYDEVAAWKYIKTPVPLAIANIKQFDFFHSHHLDWRDLIPKGLALEAPKDMYKEE